MEFRLQAEKAHTLAHQERIWRSHDHQASGDRLKAELRTKDRTKTTPGKNPHKPVDEKGCVTYLLAPLSGGVAQLVRALPCHGRGYGFEPRRSRHSLGENPSGYVFTIPTGEN